MYNIYSSLTNGYALLDAPKPWQLAFQDPATPVMEGIIDLHHHIAFFLVIVLGFVFYALYIVLYTFYFSEYYFSSHTRTFQTTAKDNSEFPKGYFLADVRFFYWNIAKYFLRHKLDRVTHGTTIEIVWTIIPSLILIAILIPSIALLYSMDEVIDPTLTIKVIGHQWYWSYEYDFANIFYDSETLKSFFTDPFSKKLLVNNVAFDSYMIPEDELEEGDLRLLEVDNPVVVPANTHIRFLITASDVLHSWAVPSLGIKTDAVPGRLNQTNAFIKREGTFYGQCSEICGVNHGFMPITIKAVDWSSFLLWLKSHVND